MSYNVAELSAPTEGAITVATLGAIERWDDEADVVVLGFGLAGACAAIEAFDADPSADVLIVEKMPEHLAGGNSRVSGQTLCFPSSVEGVMTYQRALNGPTPVPEPLLRTWAEARVEQQAWVAEMGREVGMELFAYANGMWGRPESDFPELPGSESIEGIYSLRPAQPGARTDGSATPRDEKLYASAVYDTFATHVRRRPIRLTFETRAVDLVQDADTREVFGVVTDRDGERCAIRARRGVVLCVGGYEANLEMQRDYAGYEQMHPFGSPANTGDGIRMLQRAGADLWHLRNRVDVAGIRLAMKFPEYPSVFGRNFFIRSGSWIDIAKDDRRFWNEVPDDKLLREHMKRKIHGNWIDPPFTTVLPIHMLFDETTRAQDAIGDQDGRTSWNVVVEGYRWSPDNAAEVERGWITQAPSIRELAVAIGRDPDAVEQTVDRWNESAVAGSDEEFGRDPARMAPIATPPFYAVELVPGVGMTTGGGKRDSRARVLDHDGVPIPRLYEAGELGSMFCNLYQTGSMLTEAMVFGRIAGANAAAEPAWTTD